MKRRIAVLLVVLLTVFTTSCAPKGMDKNTFSLGKEAVSVAEQFTSGKITTSEAVSKLQNIDERLENIKNGGISIEERGKNLEVQFCITDLSFAIEYGDITGDSITDALVALKTLLQ